jgi:hypothetical protein
MMSKAGYGAFAVVSLVSATALGITGLIVGLSAVEVVAVISPLIGVAGTVVGRGGK